MELFEINPFVRFAQRRNYIPRYTNFVMTYDYRLFFSCHDEIGIAFENHSVLISENQFIIIPPATKYKILKVSDPDYIVLNFDMDFESSSHESTVSPCSPDEFKYKNILSKNLYNTEPIIFSGNENMKKMLTEMCDAYTKKSLYYMEKNSALLKNIIVESTIFTNLDKTPKTVDDIKKYIEKNYGKDITNTELSNVFGYHANHLNRLFKTHTKMSLHEFIIDVRLTKAVEMINNTDFSITKVGEMCNFSSSSYFIKKFKEKYGIPPLKFRNQKYGKI